MISGMHSLTRGWWVGTSSPIAARSSRRVRIAYEEAVPVSGNSRHYTYPLPSVRRGEATVGHFAVDDRVAG